MKKLTVISIFLFSSFVHTGLCRVISVTAADNLNDIIDKTTAGDQVLLSSGTYFGNFTIKHSITLLCSTGAVIDGNHQADVLRIQAANVIIKNCEISNWGDNLTAMNAGIFVEKSASGILIENNYLHGDTFGIWLDSTNTATLRNNRIQGNLSIRSQDRGNGIHLFNVSNTIVENNQVWHTRDGIYIDTSNNNRLINNHLHHLRYGIHYMYSYSNHIENNLTNNTRTGYALMQSKYLTVINNHSKNDSNYGILMNYIVHSTIAGNQITSIHQQQGANNKQTIKGAEGKALFIYNAPFNHIHSNVLTQSDIAIHLTAGSEGNHIYNNYFVKNKRQVKYVANRNVEWSFREKGNYWSDYQGWDRNNDGIGDEPFEPNDAIDKILWKYPDANLLINSPAIETLRWVQKEFPVLKSPGIKDSYPLMKNN